MLKMLKKIYKTYKTYILVFTLFIASIQLPGQEVCDLSFCIRTGLERNFSLQVVRNQEVIANNNFSRGNAGMLPLITSSNRFGGSINNSTQNMSNGETEASSGIHNTSGSAAINMGMTIFRGFQVQNTYQKLGEQSDLQSLNTQMSVENLVAQIASEYNYYIQQLILYENMAYAVSLSRERVRIDEERYLLGSASKVELLQSMVYLNSDSSRYARQQEVLRTTQIKLNELMAADDLGRNIVPPDTFITINEELNYDELLELTLQYNTSLQLAVKNQVISELDYKIIESRAYPYLTMTTGYGYNYNAYNASSINNQHTRGANYAVNMGFDIFDGFNRRRERSNARIEIENKQIRYNEVEQKIKAELLSIFYAYENNIRLLRLEEQNLEVARENLEIALERYKLGSLSGIELREVQKSLLDAEERLVSVKYLTKLAEISLLHISGDIMEYV
jgi:outer membrane protein TolC